LAKQRYVRHGDELRDDHTVVVRGGLLEADVIADDAERYHAMYGTYGISVFAARDVTIEELAQDPPLVRFPVLTLVRVGVLRAAGLCLEPTGRNPRHFTVAFDDLDTGVEALLHCEQQCWDNPYHED
jgi:hypothetical protein